MWGPGNEGTVLLGNSNRIYRMVCSRSVDRPDSLRAWSRRGKNCFWVPRVIPVLLTVIWMSPCVAASNELDAEFLEGLRARRLFELAEICCSQQLKRQQAGSTEELRWAIELSRTYAQHALHLEPGYRETLWHQARDCVSTFESSHPDHPQLVLVKLQRALVGLARGEVTRQEAEITAASGQPWDEVRAELRRVIGLLDQLLSDITRQTRQRNRVSGSLTDAQLYSLQRNVSHQLVRAYRNQGLAYPPQSVDRINALTQALEQLGPWVSPPPTEEVVWSLRLEHVSCYRLLGDARRAGAALQMLRSATPPASVQPELRAEQLRLAIDQGELHQVARWIAEPLADQKVRSANLDLAEMEGLIALWAAGPKNDPQTSTWQNKIVHKLNQIGQLHGPYWKRRSGMLVVRAAEGGVDAGHVQLLVETAQNLYADQQRSKAMEVYEKAARLSKSLGERDRSFRLSFTAARIAQEQGDLQQSLVRFRTLGLEYRPDSQASEAHLMAVACAADLIRQDPEASWDEYMQLLREHLESWPHAASADSVRWSLGNIYERQRDWTNAVNVYRDISLNHARKDRAIRATGKCWIEKLRHLQNSGSRTTGELKVALEYFENFFRRNDGKFPERWSPTARAAVLEAARLHMQCTTQGLMTAQSYLKAVLRDTSRASSQWSSAAEVLLIEALARQGRMEEAGRRLAILTRPSTNLMDLLKSLAQLSRPSQPFTQRQQSARLQLMAVSSLDRVWNELSTADQVFAHRSRAEALALVGDRHQALQELERLVRENPRHAKVQESYAQLLLENDDRPSRELALAKWREIARHSRPKTESWYHAKYSLALTHYRLGNARRAAEILGLVQAIPPGFEGARGKHDFLELLKLCQEAD